VIQIKYATSQTAKRGQGDFEQKLAPLARKRQDICANDDPETLLTRGFHELLGVAPGDDCACLGVALSMSRQACGTTSSRRDAAQSSASLAKRWRNRCPGRWRVTALPSRSPGKHGKFNFLGTSRLQLRLERMAGLPPQSWEIEFDATRHLHVAPLLEAALADS
jgi:hypothetical protein